MRRIVFTQPDGRVAICAPIPWAIRTMATGGFYDQFAPGFAEEQIERQIAAGIPADAARRYCRAVQFGGCTTAEALAIIRDRDCHWGVAHEIVDLADLPDQWFRDAWRRGHNGGPIDLDIHECRRIQFARARDAVDTENRRRCSDIDLFTDPIEPDWPVIRDRIRRAETPQELRRIWPM